MTETPIQDELRRGLRWLQFTTIALVLALAGLIAYVLVLALSTQSALCKFRAGVKSQAAFTQSILDSHEGDPVIFGIPRPVYESSIKTQQRTIDSLQDLGC